MLKLIFHCLKTLPVKLAPHLMNLLQIGILISQMKIMEAAILWMTSVKGWPSLCFSSILFLACCTQMLLANRQVKRPNLIPLSQLNGPGPNDVKYQRKYNKKDKKGHNSNHGIIAKITSGIQRHSSQPSIVDGDVQDLSNSVTPSQPNKPLETNYESRSNNSTNLSQQSGQAKRKAPPKSPRSSHVSKNVQRDSSSSLSYVDNELESPRPVPAPRLKSKSSPISPQNIAHDKMTSTMSASMNDVSGNVSTLDNQSVAKKSGSFGSAESVASLSSIGSQSHEPQVRTMADVITEMSYEESEPVSDEASTASTDKFEENEHLLTRNKTLRWTGNRKAPNLIREFTRKQKRLQRGLAFDDALSPNQEVESITSAVKERLVKVDSGSRSNTPSQQTTSFGMADDAENSEVFYGRKEGKRNSEGQNQPAQKTGSGKRESAFITLSSFLPPAPKLRRTQSSKVRAFLQKMGTNENNALGYAVIQFVSQTKKIKETRPLVLLHDIRSFLTDIKRYVISNPHIGLVKKIQRIVVDCTTMDIEGAVDDALDRLVLYPLHDVVYRCMVASYTASGKLTIMQESLKVAKNKSNKELGIRDTLIPPDEESLEVISSHFSQLQRTYSPYFKLKELLAAVTKIYRSTKDLNTDDHSASRIGADDFLPLLVYSITHCDFLAADIETQYIDGLLDPNLLVGEGGYYLTTLISAIQVLLSMKRKETALPNITDLQGFLKVGICSKDSRSPSKAKESDLFSTSDDCIFHKTLHVPPTMTCRSLCLMISKKFNVVTPEDYYLHIVVNGIPHALEPNECPQLVKTDLLTQFPANSFYFSYQRRKEDAKPFEKIADDVTTVVHQSSDMLIAVTDKDGTAVDEKSQKQPAGLVNDKKNQTNPSDDNLLEEKRDNGEKDFDAHQSPHKPLTVYASEETNSEGPGFDEVKNIANENILASAEVKTAIFDEQGENVVEKYSVSESEGKSNASSTEDESIEESPAKSPDKSLASISESPSASDGNRCESIDDNDTANPLTSESVENGRHLLKESWVAEIEQYEARHLEKQGSSEIEEELSEQNESRKTSSSEGNMVVSAESNTFESKRNSISSDTIPTAHSLQHVPAYGQSEMEDEEAFVENLFIKPSMIDMDDRRETVASLTEYFEYKTVEASGSLPSKLPGVKKTGQP
ncbi:uncharacterized protein LOC143461889 isoform X1 [Clavelina lepadiformis]|uniref:Uncharacterized protein n=1 Tax=Clavelina lepadiformis TaxID=159417 RepID=A0ABP0GQ10_CLALP